MLKTNWKKLAVVLALFAIYIVLAAISAKYSELKTPLLIIFAINSLFAVVMYLGLKYTNRKKEKHVVSTQEDAYLKKKHGPKYTSDNVNHYFYLVAVLLSVCLLLAGLPLVVAGVI